MRNKFQITCFCMLILLTLQSICYSECKVKRTLWDYLTGSSTIECKVPYEENTGSRSIMSDNEALIVGGIIVGVCLVLLIEMRNKVARSKPSITHDRIHTYTPRYDHLRHLIKYSSFNKKDLLLEPQFFVGKKFGLGFSVKF